MELNILYENHMLDYGFFLYDCVLVIQKGINQSHFKYMFVRVLLLLKVHAIREDGEISFRSLVCQQLLLWSGDVWVKPPWTTEDIIQTTSGKLIKIIRQTSS